MPGAAPPEIRAMPRRLLVKLSVGTLIAALGALVIGCATKPARARDAAAAPAAAPVEQLPPVMLGIDVLEADSFRAIAGKKIGLLTHPAGVSRRGESTIDVLRRAPNVKLVALFAPEHGFEGTIAAGKDFGDARHVPTGLPIFSLHGAHKKPTAAMLKGIDAVVIDLQDIGVRSYTFTSAMVYAMAGCFENNVEVLVLDRPNPLGGLKVHGPPLDADQKSYVGVFRVPYVHGLTIGELARMAKDAPGTMFVPGAAGINVPDAVRARGRLTVVPMRGWTRNMRWPETGLTWIPTSPNIPTFDAAVGYAMVGLGTQNSGWSWGIGRQFPFRGIGYKGKTADEVIRAMQAYPIAGVKFVKVEGLNSQGKPVPGVYVEVTDWEKWNPTELSFYMHKQAAIWNRLNPFAVLTTAERRAFNIHVGSTAWFDALVKFNGRVDVPAFLKMWDERAAVYREQSRKYWLYPWNDGGAPAPAPAAAARSR